MGDFKNTQFDFLFSAIADKYPAIAENGSSKQYQFSGSPIEASWLKGNDIEAYNFANRVAASVNGFYAPLTGSLYNSFTDLILSITPGIDNEKDPTYVNLMSQKSTAQSNYNAALTQAKVAWQSFCDQNTDPKTGMPSQGQTEWFNNPLGGLQYKSEIDKYSEQLSDLSGRISTLVKSFNGALADAQAKLKDKTYFSNYQQLDGQMISLPTITINGDLGSDLSNWKSYPEDQYDLDVTLTKESVVKHPWKTFYDTKVEQHCLSTSVKTSVETSRIIEDKNYKLRVMIKGFQSYGISFGEWYSPAYVNPETAKFSKASTVDSATFFGADNGVLHMIPSLVWIMYRPKIELTVSTDLYKQTIEGALNTGVNWVNIMGTFRFDCSAGSSLAQVGSETTQITFDSPSLQNPSVFGVTSLKRILEEVPVPMNA